MTQDTAKLRGKYPHLLIASCTEFNSRHLHVTIKQALS